jgi:hypothetical protein
MTLTSGARPGPYEARLLAMELVAGEDLSQRLE